MKQEKWFYIPAANQVCSKKELYKGGRVMTIICELCGKPVKAVGKGMRNKKYHKKCREKMYKSNDPYKHRVNKSQRDRDYTDIFKDNIPEV